MIDISSSIKYVIIHSFGGVYGLDVEELLKIPITLSVSHS